jgi:hypothetical protein
MDKKRNCKITWQRKLCVKSFCSSPNLEGLNSNQKNSSNCPVEQRAWRWWTWPVREKEVEQWCQIRGRFNFKLFFFYFSRFFPSFPLLQSCQIIPNLYFAIILKFLLFFPLWIFHFFVTVLETPPLRQSSISVLVMNTPAGGLLVAKVATVMTFGGSIKTWIPYRKIGPALKKLI